MSFPRISVRSDQMGGVPCIRGIRMPVASIVRMVANGLSTAEILDLHPELEADDIREALLYAAERLQQESQAQAAND